MKAARPVGFFLSLLVVFCTPLFSQTVTGTLQGTVIDPQGSQLPGVTVTIRNVDTGYQRVVVTNDSGFYSAPYLPLGTYDVTASLEGFGTATHRGVEITLNSTAVQDFSVGMQLAETVTVISEQQRTNTVNAEIKSSFGAEEIINRPIAPTSGPNAMLSLAESFAGYRESPNAGQNNVALSTGSSINFGNGTRGATFQINGVNNDDSSENQHRQGVPVAAIKEFQVLTNNFSAEFGRAHSSIVLVQTKSGTNQIKGDVYGSYNDSEWNAKSYFARHLPKPDNYRSQYGFTLGFPVIPDRLFAFANYDRNEFVGNEIRAVDIFLPSEYTAPRLTRGNDTPENRAFIENILSRFPQNVTLNDPRSTRGYAVERAINQPDNDWSVRLDFNPTSTDHVTGRYQASDQIRESEDVVIGEGTTVDSKQSNLGLTWTHIFSSNHVGEFRYGLGYRDMNWNITAGNNTPVVRFLGTTLPSIIGNAGSLPINREQTDHQYVLNFSSLLFNDHSLKAGFDIRRQSLDDHTSNNSRGVWFFRSVCGGKTYPNPYAAFLDGCVSTFVTQYGPMTLENEIDEENLYLEDTWHALPNLTLNLGVRYEAVAEPQEVQNRIDYGFEDKSYVDPRFGFAYIVPFNNGVLNWLTGGPHNAVVRGGYGVFHGRVFQSMYSQQGISLRQNPPNALGLTFSNSTNLADPTGGFVFVPGIPTVRHSIVAVEPGFEMPQTKQWNLTFERNLPWNSSLRLSYTSKDGSNLMRYQRTNLPVSPLYGPVTVPDHPNNAPAAGAPDLRGVTITRFNPDPCAGTGLPGAPVNAACPTPVPLGNNEISARVQRINERRPDPRYLTNFLITDGAESEFQSVQVEWTKRFTTNLHFYTSYTWSEELDSVSEPTFFGSGDTNFTGNNKKFSWGRSRFDVPHRFTFYGSYRLPFFKDRKDFMGQLLGGWHIAPSYKYSSGPTFTPSASNVDIDFDGEFDARPVALDPRFRSGTIDDPATSQADLPRSAFRNPTIFDDFDDLVGRNTFRADDLNRLDLGVYKHFPVWGDDSLALRFEMFNVLDENQFGYPNTDINSTSFGQIASMNANYIPRTLQVSLRYAY